jgi:DNA repair exonuclease SbcCD ATPase subunit
MVDHEVENTLREIRERVRAASPPAALTTAVANAPETLSATETLRAAETSPPAHLVAGRGGAFEALSRMEANLATTERAWSRLPPLLSYRRGAAARLELWLKRLIKRAFHWFTWEQVNFNSAANHALRDALAALSSHERQLAEARAELDSLRRRAADAEARAEAERVRAAAATERRHAELRAEFERTRAELERARGEIERLRAQLPELREGLRDELGSELRERVGHLAEEQRTCFRQLSLEATEAAVAHDRARRLVEARLAEVEKAVNRE